MGLFSKLVPTASPEPAAATALAEPEAASTVEADVPEPRTPVGSVDPAELSKKYGEVDHKEVLSHVMYPAVYAEYKQAQQSYGDVSTLPTNRFLQPM